MLHNFSLYFALLKFVADRFLSSGALHKLETSCNKREKMSSIVVNSEVAAQTKFWLSCTHTCTWTHKSPFISYINEGEMEPFQIWLLQLYLRFFHNELFELKRAWMRSILDIITVCELRCKHSCEHLWRINIKIHTSGQCTAYPVETCYISVGFTRMDR